MKWLPSDSWQIQSPLSVDDLTQGMSSRIEPIKLFCWSSKNRTPLQGTIHLQGFKVSRVICYRNPFLPQLYGQFTPCDNGTTIHIRMTVYPFVSAFLVCLLGVLGLFGLVCLVAAIQDIIWESLANIGIMYGFFALGTYWIFFAEPIKAKNLLTEVLLEIHKEAANKSVQSNEVRDTPPPIPRG